MSTKRAMWSERAGTLDIEHGDIFAPMFDKDGLIPAIAVDHQSREVLMVAWMNAEALQLTLTTSYAHFWTRSRRRIWQKGEESGNRLRICSVSIDCDQDVLQLEVEIEGGGVACHTGRRSCFYRRLELPNGPDEPVKLRLVT